MITPADLEICRGELREIKRLAVIADAHDAAAELEAIEQRVDNQLTALADLVAPPALNTATKGD